MGGIYFIVIMELYIYFKKYGLKKKLVLIGSSIIVLLIAILPYIVLLKWLARMYFSSSIDNSAGELELISNITDTNYFETLNHSLIYLFGRFQILSNVYLFYENISTLQKAWENNAFVSVFSAGLPQMLVYKIMHLDYTLITSYFDTVITGISLEKLTSNTHVGWIGWMLFNPIIGILYFFYTTLLIYISLLLSIKIGGRYIIFVNWYAMIVYLLHGWITTYIAYILGLMVFLVIKNISNIKLRKKNVRNIRNK